MDVAVSLTGYTYVTNWSCNCVQIFDSSGMLIDSWGSYGNGPGEFDGIRGIEVDSQGIVYVSDAYNNRVQKFTANGDFLLSWPAISPFGLTVDIDDNVWVASWLGGVIRKFDPMGNLLTEWTDNITGVRTLAVDNAGNVYAADQNANLMRKFDSSGNLITTWTPFGWDVEVDNHGSVYVATSHSVERLDSDGNLISSWGGCTTSNFVDLRGLGLDSSGRIYVADYAGGSITVFDSPTPRFACVGFEPPMAAYPVTVKKNRALPLKAELFDVDGYALMGGGISAPPVVQVWFDSGTGGDAVDVTDEVLSVGQGDDGNQFVFTESNRWQFNLSTKNYVAPGTYTVLMASGDESEYVLDPSCLTEFVVQ
jgi:streptogramin lyase